jgi:dihydrofolate reductase (trimethoprim resistance protein)
MIIPPPIATPHGFHFAFGTRVAKKRGSSWHGRVVGFYSTDATTEGYDVESEREPGSVQLYPYAALERVE